MIVIGGIGGKLKTGRHVACLGYANQDHRTTANLYVTLLQLVGSQRTSFGIPDPNLKDLDQHAPLEELPAERRGTGFGRLPRQVKCLSWRNSSFRCTRTFCRQL